MCAAGRSGHFRDGERDNVSGLSVAASESALYEAWTEGKVVLRKCIRQGSVDFMDYRQLLTEFIELWSYIRPFIRCTGHPGANGKADSVSQIYCFYVVLICVLFPPSFFFSDFVTCR